MRSTYKPALKAQLRTANISTTRPRHVRGSVASTAWAMEVEVHRRAHCAGPTTAGGQLGAGRTGAPTHLQAPRQTTTHANSSAKVPNAVQHQPYWWVRGAHPKQVVLISQRLSQQHACSGCCTTERASKCHRSTVGRSGCTAIGWHRLDVTATLASRLTAVRSGHASACCHRNLAKHR